MPEEGMNNFGLTFHHLGLAVKKPEPAAAYLAGLGYVCEAAVFDPLQNVNLFMAVHSDMPNVEVIYPSASAGPLDGMLNNRPEGIIYHLCYVSLDVLRSIAAIKRAGIRVVELSPKKPAVLFKGVSVSFYMVMNFGLIEIIGE